MSANHAGLKSLASVSPKVLKRALSTDSNSSDSHKRHKRDDYDDRFSAIEEHGVIGNMRTAALVSVSAEISWFCFPFFDSPSIFASILDREKGGHWCITTYVEEGDVKSPASKPPPEHNNRPSPPPASRKHRPPPPKSSPEADEQRELLRRYVTHKQLYAAHSHNLSQTHITQTPAPRLVCVELNPGPAHLIPAHYSPLHTLAVL